MKRILYPLLAVACMGMVACTTSEKQAPVEDRSVIAGAPAVARTGGPDTYTVAKGDTLYRISRAHNVKVADLVAWNNLGNANAINEGQVLRVAPPGSAGAAATPAGGAVQTGSVGDASSDVQPIDAARTETKPQPVAEKQAVAAASGSTREVGGVTWAWPASGKTLTGFADGKNKGIDIAGAKGDKVLSAADGRVIYAGTMSGYGNLVIVKHTDDLLTAYAHNNSNLVAQGSSVSRGQQIAEIGSSGTDAVKLHFEVRRQGKPVDPMGYLPKR